MAKQFDDISDDHRQFIEAQHIFFCGSAAEDGRVNISPKGMDSLRVMGPNRSSGATSPDRATRRQAIWHALTVSR